ncbi:MAG TPA: ComF family protein [Chloroflexota bacterium]|nr:ComF family protein [Chloroflexota bacterium]
MINRILDLLFPRRCIGCRIRGTWLCTACEHRLARLPGDHCRRCAHPFTGTAVCARCWSDPPAFDGIVCGFLFDGTVRQAIHALKYRRARHLAHPLVDALLAVAAPSAPADLVVPVPLHPHRQSQRGYNQAALIARSLGERLALPVREDALVRVRDTPPQVALAGSARLANLRGAFCADPSVVSGLAVLLVDDVATTGATLREAAGALKRAGARRVEAVILARTP